MSVHLFDNKWRKETGQRLYIILRDAMDGSDYERGALEEAQATADNVREVLARLLLHLHETGMTKEDLGKIMDPGTLGHETGDYKWPKKD